MRRILPPILCILIGLSACGAEVPEVTIDDAELQLGRDIWSQRCQSCHGATGSGGIGVSLLNIEERLSFTDQHAIVSAGRNEMPSFEGILSAADIAAVTRYTREVL